MTGRSGAALGAPPSTGFGSRCSRRFLGLATEPAQSAESRPSWAYARGVGGFATTGSSASSKRFTWLRWLAVVPMVIALPFLFFGLLWWDLIILVGMLLLVVGVGVWILFADDD